MNANEQLEKINAAKERYSTASAACKKAYDKLIAHLKSVIEKNIDTTKVKVSNIHADGATLVVIGSNHDISLYFYKPYNNEKRKLEINFGCFGSFSKDDVHAVTYCETLGHVARIMNVLEHELLFSDESKKLFEEHDALARAANDIRYEIERLERELDDYDRTLRENEISQSIKEGLKIVVRQATHWHNEVVKTIDHVMPKTIIFVEDYGRRTSKDEVIRNLLSRKWSIA